MSQFKILCMECGKQQVITGDEAPRFCPLCGHANIREVTTVENHFLDATKMVPMKLEQLREMLENDGEIIGATVIVSENGVLSHAVLDARVDDGICASTGANDEWLKENDYGIKWLAYAYPAEHIDREAWTAEWKEYTGADAGFHYCSKCGQQAFNYEDGAEVVEVLSCFCPSCGRAMTLEAWNELKKRIEGINENNKR